MWYTEDKDYDTLPKYDPLYPFDGGSCDRCKNSLFEHGVTMCTVYRKDCCEIHNCMSFVEKKMK